MWYLVFTNYVVSDLCNTSMCRSEQAGSEGAGGGRARVADQRGAQERGDIFYRQMAPSGALAGELPPALQAP
mgnify:CR=1 FL=1